jgi:FKBP-type peptidyl-prolyl cis-trans isomerase FklB
MKRFLFVFTSLAMTLSALRGEDKPAFKDQTEKASYSLGVMLARQWKQQGMEPSQEALFRGIKDSLTGTQPVLTDAEMRETWNAYMKDIRAKQEEKRKAEADTNKAEATKFFAENKVKPGVITLPSGLQYKVLSEGNGPTPSSSDTVEVNYRGTLLNGTEFDSSYKNGKPTSFPVFGVIKGWSEALQLMKVGAKWQLFIPSDIAYGDRGKGMAIPPGAALVFEVELVGIKPPVAPPAPPIVTSDIIKVPSQEEIKKGAQIEVIKAPKEGEKPAPKK